MSTLGAGERRIKHRGSACGSREIVAKGSLGGWSFVAPVWRPSPFRLGLAWLGCALTHVWRRRCHAWEVGPPHTTAHSCRLCLGGKWDHVRHIDRNSHPSGPSIFYTCLHALAQPLIQGAIATKQDTTGDGINGYRSTRSRPVWVAHTFANSHATAASESEWQLSFGSRTTVKNKCRRNDCASTTLRRKPCVHGGKEVCCFAPLRGACARRSPRPQGGQKWAGSERQRGGGHKPSR